MLIRTRDELATTLEHRIVSGAVAPGELLPSRRMLSEEYRLSRSMVREALRTLAERRLIDVVPGRGSFVRGASVEESAERLTDVFDQRQVTARYLIETRSMVETTAAWLAAERANDADLRAVSQALFTLIARRRCPARSGPISPFTSRSSTRPATRWSRRCSGRSSRTPSS